MDVLKGSLGLINPLLDKLLLSVDKDKALIVLFSSPLLRIEIQLLFTIIARTVLICDQGDYLVVLLLQRDLHDVGHLAMNHLLWIAAKKHFVSGKLALVDAYDLSQWNQNVGPIREVLPSNVVLVNEDGMFIEHNISLHDVVMLVKELADGAFQNDAIFLAKVQHFSLVFLDEIVVFKLLSFRIIVVFRRQIG